MHIGDKSNSSFKVSIKIDKIGTSYFTVSVNATSNQGAITDYIFVVDEVEKTPVIQNSYTEENLEEKSTHTVKVIARDDKANTKESRTIKLTTEEKLYLYKDGIFSQQMGGIVEGGHYGSSSGTVNQYEKYFNVYTNSNNTAHYGRSKNEIDFLGYRFLCAQTTRNGRSQFSNFYNKIIFM